MTSSTSVDPETIVGYFEPRYASRMSFAEEMFPRKRFTADEVMRMVETGVLRDDEPVELLEGELIVVSPQGPRHASRTVYLQRLLERRYGHGWHVRPHSPVRGTIDSIPEPDLAVVRGEPLDYEERLPAAQEVALIVEISFSSRRVDRKKAGIYARSGYACYWLVDTEEKRVELYESPTADGRYAQTRIVDAQSELALPSVGGFIKVSELIASA